MPLKTPEEYVESLRALRIRAYVGGERVDSIVDSPLIAPAHQHGREDLRVGAPPGAP